MPDNNINIDRSQKLYNAVSEKFDIGTFDEFISKMAIKEKRQRFYNAVSGKLDIGDYATFEQSILKKKLTPSPALDGELPSKEVDIPTLVPEFIPEKISTTEVLTPITEEKIEVEEAEKVAGVVEPAPPIPTLVPEFIPEPIDITGVPARAAGMPIGETPLQEQREFLLHRQAEAGKTDADRIKDLLEKGEPTGELTFMDKIGEIETIDLIPFLSGADQIFQMSELLQAVNRLDDDTASDRDVLLLLAYTKKAKGETSFMYKVMDIVAGLPSFAGELLATGGIYTVAKKVTIKSSTLLLKKLLREGGEKLIKKKAAKIATAIVGGVVGATAQAVPAGITRIPAGALKNMLPKEIEFTVDEENQVIASIIKTGDNVYLATIKSLGEQWVETVSEKSGGLFRSVGRAGKEWMIRRGILTSFFKINPKAKVSDFMKIVRSSGYDGIITEVAEERVGEILRATLQLGEWELPTPKQLAVELVAFAIPGSAISVANVATTQGKIKYETGEAEKEIEGILPEEVVEKEKVPKVEEKPSEVVQEEEKAPEVIPEKEVVQPEEAPSKEEVIEEKEQPITEATFKAELKEAKEEFAEEELPTIEKPITTKIETTERILTYDYYTETTPEGEVKYLKKITDIEEKVIPERIPPEKVPEVKPPEVPPKIPEEKLPPKEAIQRGFQKRSLEVADKTPAQKQVKAVVEGNRDYYEQMNINDEMNNAAKEISDTGGFDANYEDLRKPSKFPERVSRQAKRLLGMDHYGKLMDEAVKAKDEAKSKIYYDKINSLQEIASREATTAGQSSAILMWWKFNRPDGTVDMMKRKIKSYNERPKVKKLQEKISKETDERKRKRLEADLQKLLAKELTPEQASKLKQLAENVQKYKGKGLLEREAVTEMVRYMDSIYPTSNRFDTFVSLYYSSILAGASTHVLNMWSAGSNIVSLPIRNVTNLSLWYRAIKEGFKAGEWETFQAYNPMNEILYMPAAFAQGISKGGTAFKNVWSEGGMDNKFMERVGDNKYAKISPLERQVYGKNAFKRLRIFGLDVNPYNYYKYVGRALAAEDALMFNTVYDIQLASLLHEKYVGEGLRGKQLKKAVFDDLLARNVDKEAVIKEIDKEVEEFEKDTGIKIDKTKKKILLRERLQDRLDKELKVEAEELARDNIFTGDRGGLLANTARTIANIANRNFATAIAIKPFIPFTKVVGNVAEFMLDATPVYGIARAHGFSITGLIKRTGVDIRTAQLGDVGTRKYYEQMGRTWFGTTAFLVTSALFIGTDEDDFLEISGGYAPEGFRKRGRENVMPKYSIRIGNMIIPYMNIPILSIPLAMIGNYNDRLKLGDKEEDLFDRLTATALLSLNVIIEMSFMTGVQRLFEFMSDALEEAKETSKVKIRKEEGIEKRVYRMMDESKTFKGLFKTYFGVVTKIAPQNFNLIQQGQKLLDPTSYSQKDISDILKYNIGILRSELLFPNIDVLGEPIKTYPGETLLPYTHWLGLKGKDKRWKFLSKYNSIPTGIYNMQMYIDDEYRRLIPRELYKYTKLSGQNFNEKLLEYMEDTSEVIKREKEEITIKGKIITGVQKDIKDLWTDSKKEAKVELGFTKEIVPTKRRGKRRGGRR